MKKRNKKLGLIFAGVGSAGFIWTAIDAARCAKKHGDRLKWQHGFKQKVKYLFKCYWRPILEGTASTALVVGGSVIDYKAIVGLSGAAAAGLAKYDEYRKANVAANGKEADTRALKVIASDRYRRGIITAKEDETLFLDDFTGEFFISTWEDVKEAIRKVNRNYHIQKCEPFTEYLEMIGILDIGMEERYGDWGWGLDIMEDLEHRDNIDVDETYPEDITDDGIPFHHIRFIVDPYSPEETAFAYF